MGLLLGLPVYPIKIPWDLPLLYLGTTSGEGGAEICPSGLWRFWRARGTCGDKYNSYQSSWIYIISGIYHQSWCNLYGNTSMSIPWGREQVVLSGRPLPRRVRATCGASITWPGDPGDLWGHVGTWSQLLGNILDQLTIPQVVQWIWGPTITMVIVSWLLTLSSKYPKLYMLFRSCLILCWESCLFQQLWGSAINYPLGPRNWRGGARIKTESSWSRSALICRSHMGWDWVQLLGFGGVQPLMTQATY